ncbi:hypothetical protein QBC32DRAFT_353644 [Pseudoneurospora amorphoporcata]|uniref:Uncharacterized protein n=1 Tax=Pseudoneurospora amorphoporcata TaxID=241081 RepID=A0AAN6SB24_9PEZI|nr:hypothetical protein QBC32DRAFT_353644 [Pseudoneurospora amorphoporcata]
MPSSILYLPFGVVLHPCALLLVWLAVVASGKIGIVSWCLISVFGTSRVWLASR